MTFKKLFLFLFFGISCSTVLTATCSFTEKKYQKEYYANGTLKAEGWELGSYKTDYWYFYHPNGKVASKGSFRKNTKQGYWYYFTEHQLVIKEGHYENGIAQHWWIFYDIAPRTERRVQYQNDKKNGFALIYKNGKLKRAEKYKADKKIAEWVSIFAFKKDNPHVSF